MVKYTTEETEHLKLSRLLEAVKKVNEHLNEAKVRTALVWQQFAGMTYLFPLLTAQARQFNKDGRHPEQPHLGQGQRGTFFLPFIYSWPGHAQFKPTTHAHVFAAILVVFVADPLLLAR
jgi:hypothetical protein